MAARRPPASSSPARSAPLAAVHTERDEQARNEVSGAALNVDLARGEPIRRSPIVKPGDRDFLQVVLTSGARAIAIPISSVGSGTGLLYPGDRVDVVLTQNFNSEGLARRSVSETIAQNLRMLAIDPPSAQGGRSVMLEVTPEQAEKVGVAAELGKLSLLLRRAGDIAPVSGTADNRARPTWAGDVSPALATIKPAEKAAAARSSVGRRHPRQQGRGGETGVNRSLTKRQSHPRPTLASTAAGTTGAAPRQVGEKSTLWLYRRNSRSIIELPTPIERSDRLPAGRVPLLAFVADAKPRRTSRIAGAARARRSASCAAASTRRSSISPANARPASWSSISAATIFRSSRVFDLADVCEPAVTVIAIGDSNDVAPLPRPDPGRRHRIHLQAGDARSCWREALSSRGPSAGDGDQPQGSASSSPASARAAASARRRSRPASPGISPTARTAASRWLDLDLQHGDCALALNLKTTAGLARGAGQPAARRSGVPRPRRRGNTANGSPC